MADKRIDELEEAVTITYSDLFVLEQAGAAKKLSGQTMTSFLLALANGHGGIDNIAKTSSAGTDPVVDTYTITYADATSTTFQVTNGKKGAKGDTGDTGPKGDNITITSYTVRYQEWTSGTSTPSGTWVSTPPAVAQGNYLWTRTIVNYSDGTSTTAYSVARMGVDGTGAVSTVCGVSPDGNGDVTLTASDVGALPSTYTAPVTSVNGQTGTVSITPSGIGAAELDSNSKVLADQASASIISNAGDLTLNATHAGKYINITGSNAATVTLPLNSAVPIPIGTEIEICQYGAGKVTIAPVSSSVTIHSLDDLRSTAGRYAVICLKKITANTWLLAGALS